MNVRREIQKRKWQTEVLERWKEVGDEMNALYRSMKLPRNKHN